MLNESEVREAVNYFREIYEGAENKELEVLVSLGEAYLSAGSGVEEKKYENYAYLPNQDWINGYNCGWNGACKAHRLAGMKKEDK